MNSNGIKSTKISISEIFYSIQGEGLTMGVPAFFIRLRGCNLMCGGWGTQKDKLLHDGATWRCDTIETWLEGHRKSFEVVLNDLNASGPFDQLNGRANIIFTGGEPMLQPLSVIAFIDYLKTKTNYLPFIEMETNGTITPSVTMISKVNLFNVSPKLGNSGMSLSDRINKEAIRTFSEISSMFKFVIRTEQDYEEIKDTYFPIHRKVRDKTILMPAASSASELIESSRIVTEIAKKNGHRFSSRLQLAIWDQAVGI